MKRRSGVKNGNRFLPVLLAGVFLTAAIPAVSAWRSGTATAGLAIAAPDSRVAQEAGSADLILTGAEVWTGNPRAPRAEAIAIRGAEILAVGEEARVLERRGSQTEVRELNGRFVAPGFIDNHTHFDRAGELLLGINLLDVSDPEGLVERVRAAEERLPEGAWILGGDWGAYENDADGRFRPHRAHLDSITPERAVLLSRWDGSLYLANGRALQAAGAECSWPGVECVAGEATGRLTPEAAARVREAAPSKSTEQRLEESRRALERLREQGVTTIHDITPPSQIPVYQELRDRGELTVRVYARPTLDRWAALRDVGIEHGFGSEWIRIGGLKGFVDGIMGNSSARFYEPYLHTGERGEWRDMMTPAGNMQELLIGADSSGHWPQVHAIGDQAIDTLLAMYERMMETNEARERRLRVIHAQVLSGPGAADRMAALDAIAEVQPYHAIDDMRWMEERIGERARWAYAFRTLQEAGVRLSFGSDWPGTNASWYPASPVQGMYAAVTRRTLEGDPEDGWFPEERVDVETALRAYTVNNAYAAGEEEIKGSLEAGKLADLVVLDRNPLDVSPEELKDLRVLMTMVGGEVVFDAVTS